MRLLLQLLRTSFVQVIFDLEMITHNCVEMAYFASAISNEHCAARALLTVQTKMAAKK